MKKYATVETLKSTMIFTSALTWFLRRTVPSSRNANPPCIASTMTAPIRMNSVSLPVFNVSMSPPCSASRPRGGHAMLVPPPLFPDAERAAWTRPAGSVARPRSPRAVIDVRANEPLGRLPTEELLQLARLVHLAHDVAAADEFALHVELRNRRPVRVILDPLADLRVGEHVDGEILPDAAQRKHLHGSRGKAALRHLRRALHVEDDVVLRHLVANPFLNAHGKLRGIDASERRILAQRSPRPSCGAAGAAPCRRSAIRPVTPSRRRSAPRRSTRRRTSRAPRPAASRAARRPSASPSGRRRLRRAR